MQRLGRAFYDSYIQQQYILLCTGNNVGGYRTARRCVTARSLVFFSEHHTYHSRLVARGRSNMPTKHPTRKQIEALPVEKLNELAVRVGLKPPFKGRKPVRTQTSESTVYIINIR